MGIPFVKRCGCFLWLLSLPVLREWFELAVQGNGLLSAAAAAVVAALEELHSAGKLMCTIPFLAGEGESAFIERLH